MTSVAPAAQLYFGSNTSDPIHTLLGRGEAVVFSQPCPTIEGRENEDSAALLHIPGGGRVFAVADGVGGIPGGRQASARALEVFMRIMQRALDDEARVREAVLDGFDAANRAVLDLGTGGCTTMAVAAIERDQLRTFHVGDSAVVVTGQRGKLKHVTVAHSPVGYAIESGLLDESEAMSHEDRHVVSNVLGSTNMKIEIGPKIRLASRDTVALASDGVLDNLSIDELVGLVRAGSIRKAGRTLATTTIQRMTEPPADRPSKPDDATFVLYRPTRSKAATPKPPRDDG